MMSFYKKSWFGLVVSIALAKCGADDAASTAPPVQGSSGGSNSAMAVKVSLGEWPKRGRLDLPWNGGEISGMTLSTSPLQYVSAWEVRPRDQMVRVFFKHAREPVAPGVLQVESLSAVPDERSGRLVLKVADGQVVRVPESNFACEWKVKPPVGGVYAVEVTGRAGMEEGEAVEIGCGEHWVSGLLEDTGNFRRWVNTPIGVLALKGGEEQVVQLRLGEGRFGYRADALAVVFRHMPGETISQSSALASKWWRGARVKAGRKVPAKSMVRSQE